MGKFRSLEKSLLASSWSLEERAALAFFLEERRFNEGDPVFNRMAKEAALYLVEQGGVRLQYEQYSVDLKEGASFGELSLFQETTKLVTATALGNCIVWILTKEKYEELRKNTPSVAVKLMESIIQKMGKVVSEALMPPRIFQKSSPGSSKQSHNQV